jgi:hypothetical protein
VRETVVRAWVSWQAEQFCLEWMPWAPRVAMALWQVVQLGLEMLWDLWQELHVLWVGPLPRAAEACPLWQLAHWLCQLRGA